MKKFLDTFLWKFSKKKQDAISGGILKDFLEKFL